MSSRVTLTVHLKRQHLLYTCYVHLLYIKVCLLSSLRVQWNMLVAFSSLGKGFSLEEGGISQNPVVTLCWWSLWVSRIWGLANSGRLPFQREMPAQPLVLHESSESFPGLLLMAGKSFGFRHLPVPILAIIQEFLRLLSSLKKGKGGGMHHQKPKNKSFGLH